MAKNRQIKVSHNESHRRVINMTLNDCVHGTLTSTKFNLIHNQGIILPLDAPFFKQEKENWPNDKGIDINNLYKATSSICSRISPASLQDILSSATVLHGTDGDREPVRLYTRLLNHQRNPYAHLSPVEYFLSPSVFLNIEECGDTECKSNSRCNFPEPCISE